MDLVLDGSSMPWRGDSSLSEIGSILNLAVGSGVLHTSHLESQKAAWERRRIRQFFLRSTTPIMYPIVVRRCRKPGAIA